MGFSLSKIAKRAVGVLSGKDLFDSLSGKNAAERASGAQQAAAQQGITEQRSQWEQAQEIMKPYVQAGIPALGGLQQYADAGTPALQQQQAYLGLRGPEEQQAFIDNVSNSPLMQSMMQQGEDAMLQNASATGGLRGGNTQAALAQFRPAMLQNMLDQRYGQLGGLTGMGMQTQGNLAQLGQAASAGQAAQGMQTGANIANLYGQQGAAVAGGQQAIQQGRMGLLNLGIQGGKAAMGIF